MTDGLRVALFSGNYNYVKDGANQALNRLVGHLLRRGCAVRVYSPTTDAPAFEPVGDLVSVPSIAFPFRNEYRFGFPLTPALIADLDGFGPDIIHLSSPDMTGHSALAYAEERGLPVVASVHTRFETYFQYYKLGWFQRRAEQILRNFYRRCTEIYPPSQSMADVLRAQGMSDAIHIWSRGVDHHVFRPQARDLEWRQGLGIAPGAFTIGFVGRLVLEKGLDVLVEASHALAARGVAHHVLVTGEGPARAMLEDNLPDAVLLGFQSGDALARAYASADVLFNPSSTETFGNVTLEAMACGLPVVAAAATGSLSLVEDGRSGLLVGANDVAASTDALARYAVDPALRAAHGARGLELARRYAWDEINDRLLGRYLAVLGRQRLREAA